MTIHDCRQAWKKLHRAVDFITMRLEIAGMAFKLCKPKANFFCAKPMNFLMKETSLLVFSFIICSACRACHPG